MSTRPQKRVGTQCVPTLFLDSLTLYRPVLCRHRRQNPVRIRHSEIGELAHQAESERILAVGEIPETWH